jgi:hypothetical protein
MTGADLRREYLCALGTTAPKNDLDPLLSAGVSRRAISIAMPALVRVAVHGGFYHPEPDSGGLAYVIPVRVDDPFSPEAIDPAEAINGGGIVDLVAFHPAHPHRWALRVGAAEWLGAVEPQYMGPAAVQIWRSPLDWLRADCRGLVILSPDPRDQYRLLSSFGALLVEDVEYATELRQILARPWPGPCVLLGNRGRRHAAQQNSLR